MTDDAPDAPTDLQALRITIEGTFIRDGQLEWEEAARLAELLAAEVWGQLHLFPLAAPPAPAALDVERLVRVIEALQIAGYYLDDNGAEEDAESIAAEYARLSDETEP